MHPRLAELLSHLDSERDALDRVVSEVPPEARDRRPAPDSWSVAEVLDHLARVEGGVARLVAVSRVKVLNEASLSAVNDARTRSWSSKGR